MYVVGLTGGLGTGKSTVAAMFAQLGADIIDADKIAHEELKSDSNSFKRIIKTFGPEILTNGQIDRKKLAAIVFNNKTKLRKLEAIIHPAVRQEIRKQIQLKKRRAKNRIVIVEIPLLFESKIDWGFDTTMVVTSKKNQQVSRAVSHIKITALQAKKRINNQMPLAQKIRLADIIIDNSQTKNKTKDQVKRIWQKLSIRKNQ